MNHTNHGLNRLISALFLTWHRPYMLLFEVNAFPNTFSEYETNSTLFDDSNDLLRRP